MLTTTIKMNVGGLLNKIVRFIRTTFLLSAHAKLLHKLRTGFLPASFNQLPTLF